MGIWQFIAGGGEADETLLEAAKREANEEAGNSLRAMLLCTGFIRQHSYRLLSGRRIENDGEKSAL